MKKERKKKRKKERKKGLEEGKARKKKKRKKKKKKFNNAMQCTNIVTALLNFFIDHFTANRSQDGTSFCLTRRDAHPTSVPTA